LYKEEQKKKKFYKVVYNYIEEILTHTLSVASG